MKKCLSLVLMMVMMVMILSGCTFLSSGNLESMFKGSGSSNTGPTVDLAATMTGDTVTISRAEYEKYQEFSELFELMDAAEIYFYKEPDRKKMLYNAAKGLLSGMDDPYTFYYTPEEWTEMLDDDEGKYTGIGVLISANYETQICVINRIFKGSPAEEAGVKRGDILYRVGEDLFVTADNLQDAVDIMRGVPGTDVDVTFLRDGKEITLTITRKEISVNQIESAMLDDEIGYICLYQFAGDAEIEFENALKELVDNGAKGIVIDLRDNPGGWVEQARYIADLFMDEGELCYLVYRDGTEEHDEYLTKDGKYDVKIVVLVNEYSASSSEILTGALHDCADAKVVGTTSYGKGIIQIVMPVGNEGAGFQMTIAQYYTPNGTAVHGEGIAPDYEVTLPEGDNGSYQFADVENDPQLKKAVEVMKEMLQ